MNNEIKEILEQMKSIAITGKDKNDIKVDGYGLQQNELKILLDYITNLQQAVKDTKDTADDMLYELKQENERLKGRIEFLEDINSDQYAKIEKLEEENDRLKEEKQRLLYNLEKVCEEDATTNN